MCQDGQLCSGLKEVIDSAVHGDKDIWDATLSTENVELLLVNTKNAFKNIVCIGILWTVLHSWPSEACLFIY